MVFQSSYIGLVLIMIAWLLQLYYAKKDRIKKRFIILYVLGTAWIVIDSLIYDNVTVAIFNIIILALACFVLIKVGHYQISNKKNGAKKTKKKKVSKKKRK
ncbi:hypothetical protein GOV12_01010 [Candidatus Pacearchaeota archaeon]|nr:hypothetical protein [Candidatus Pacearchaeota archaeon]